MKITIIGAGNIGGAIALGLAQSRFADTFEITISDRDKEKIDTITSEYPIIKGTEDNQKGIEGAEIVILAVKPWLVEPVLSELTFEDDQILASVAAGITFDTLRGLITKPISMFRVIPNTAIRKRASMTLLSSKWATKEHEALLLDIFNELGLAMLISEHQMEAGTALASCGIAYVFKYIHAATEAGVEMGISPREAMQMVSQTVKGAAELLLEGGTHPAIEIDKVTTPGGLTIKGINTLEYEGFASAVIKAIKAGR